MWLVIQYFYSSLGLPIFYKKKIWKLCLCVCLEIKYLHPLCFGWLPKSFACETCFPVMKYFVKHFGTNSKDNMTFGWWHVTIKWKNIKGLVTLCIKIKVLTSIRKNLNLKNVHYQVNSFTGMETPQYVMFLFCFSLSFNSTCNFKCFIIGLGFETERRESPFTWGYFELMHKFECFINTFHWCCWACTCKIAGYITFIFPQSRLWESSVFWWKELTNWWKTSKSYS